jgi:uroporphyrin-3 C-methyltransferase
LSAVREPVEPQPSRPEAAPSPAADTPTPGGSVPPERRIYGALDLALERFRAGLNLPVLAALALAAFATWQWMTTRDELAKTREEVALRLRDTDAEARAGMLAAKDSQDRARESEKRIGVIESKLAESQSQQYALEAMYSELARGRDDWVLAEIDQTLSIAARELQLAGNVPGALAALQSADSRLGGLDRPQFQGLRKVIQRDIERLRGAPTVDVVGLTQRLDQLIATVDTLPLLAEGRPVLAPEPEPEAPAGWWSRFTAAVWDELKSLVRVQRLDAQDASLLAPEQAWFLRENLKLRLMHARVALLQRNDAAYRADLKAASQWLVRYFDPRDRRVMAAQQAIGQLNAASVAVEVPSISESLAAVRATRSPRDRDPR